MEHKPALVLNTDGSCLKVISWRRAICLSIIGKEIPGEGVTVLKYYEDDFAYTANDIVPIPAVVMTNRHITINKKVPISKQNLLIRDKYQCQYCGKELSRFNATVDHVIPKKHFKNKEDAHTWDNIVLSCRECNLKKGSRTPEQAKMKLRSKPAPVSRFNFLPVRKRPEWEEFFQKSKV